MIDKSELAKFLVCLPKPESATLIALSDRSTPIQEKWEDSPVGQMEIGPGGAGFLTGENVGVFVVDCDSEEAVLAFDQEFGFPDTLQVQTRRGRHYYFLWPDFEVHNSQSFLGPGIDVRGWHGYAVAAGSPNKRVEVAKRPISAPENLLVRLRMQRATKIERAWDFMPRDFSNPEYARAHSLAVQWIENKAPKAISQQKPEAKLLVVCSYVKWLRLHPDDCMKLVTKYSNTKCFRADGITLWPFTEQEIKHKLEDAIPVDRAREFDASKLVQAGDAPEMGVQAKNVDLNDVVFILNNSDEWLGKLRYDEFRHIFTASEPPIALEMETGDMTDEDVGAVRCWLQQKGAKINQSECALALRMACKRNRYHPVREYLNQLNEQDPAFLTEFCKEAFGAEGIEADFICKSLLGAVRRVFRPGTKMDTMLVFYGEQALRKTTGLEVLFQPWFRNQMPELNNRDASHALAGAWCIEFGELDKVLRTEYRTVKDYLSRTVDKYRQYGTAGQVERPRQCIFVGTTNEPDFLIDPTGSRRFWPVHIKNRIDTNFLSDNKDRMWGAVMALDRTGAAHWFDDETRLRAIHREFEVDVPLAAALVDTCAGMKFVTSNEAYLLVEGDKARSRRLPKAEQKEYKEAFIRIGAKWVVDADRGVRGWILPASIAQKALNKVAQGGLREDARAREFRAAIAKILEEN